MNLATPLALALAAIAIPIIVLYILKLRLRRVPVSTNMFWKQVFEEKPPKALWQRFRHWLSLLAQLAILGLLVFAIADPILAWHAKQARRIVMVVDTSASRQAVDVAPNRLTAAKVAGHRLLDGIREQDTVSILSAGAHPSVAIGMGNHVPSLRQTLDALQASDTKSSLSAAIELAKQLIGDAPNGQIVVFTDKPNGESDKPDVAQLSSTVPKSEETNGGKLVEDNSSAKNTTIIDYCIVGTRASNVGITQFQVRRSMVDVLGYEVLVQVRNASDQAVSCRLELDLEGRPVDVLPLQLKPDEQWSRTLGKTSMDGGLLRAKLTQWNGEKGDEQDVAKLNALGIDDCASAILPTRVIQPVLIVSPGNLFLQKVFEANSLVRVTTAKEIPETWPTDTLVILHQKIPAKLPVNGLLCIDPESKCDWFEVDGTI